ncbi:MAG: hypothetical protein ACI4PG_06495 [Candidatus Ventricola sp.]
MYIHPQGAERLTCAVVSQAVKDWRRAMRRLERDEDSVSAYGVMIDCEVFFTGGAMERLTGMDGRAFFDRLQAQAESGKKTKAVRLRI